MAKRAGGTKLSYHADGNLTAVLQGTMKKVLDKVDRDLDAKLVQLNELILAQTPVWEGDVIHNFRWSTRAPDYRYEAPIETPQEPGPTNTMALGTEPRRRANERRPRQSLAGALRAKEPVTIYLTNTSEHAVELEHGLLPTPQTSRARPGYIRLALKTVFG